MEKVKDKGIARTSSDREIFTFSAGSYITHYHVKKSALLLAIALMAICIGIILIQLPTRAAFIAAGILVFSSLLAVYPFVGLFVQIWLYFNPFVIYGGPEFLRPVFLVTFLTLTFFLFRYFTHKKYPLRFPLEGKIALVLLACMVLSSFFAVYSSSLSYSRNMALFKVIIFYFLVVNLINSKRKLDVFVWFIIFCGALESIETIRVHRFYGVVRVDTVGGLQGSSGGLSTTLVMIFPLIFQKIYSRNFYVKAISFGLVPIFIAGIILAGSRGGTLGLLGILILLLWRNKRKGFTWVILAAIVVAAVAAAPDQFWSRTMTIMEYQQDGSAMGRIHLWKAGFQMFFDHPLTGIGQGNFEWVSPQYTHTYYQDWLGKGFVAHNVFIQLLAEGGIQTLLAFLLLFLLTFQSLRRVRRMAPPSPVGNDLRELSLAVEFGLIGFLICGFFISREGTDILYWLLSMGPVCWYLVKQEMSSLTAIQEPQPAAGV